MRQLVPLLAIVLAGCSSTTLYYPPETAFNERGQARTVSRKAFQTYGDSIGPTRVVATRDRVEYSAAGGNDNSIVTGILAREAGSIARWGIGWGFSWAILKSFFGNASSAYNANQATAATKAANAPKAAPLPQVGSTIPAQTSAVVTPVP